MIYTDYRSLLYAQTANDWYEEMAMYMKCIGEYDIQIHHCDGIRNRADLLTRNMQKLQSRRRDTGQHAQIFWPDLQHSEWRTKRKRKNESEITFGTNQLQQENVKEYYHFVGTLIEEINMAQEIYILRSSIFRCIIIIKGGLLLLLCVISFIASFKISNFILILVK